MAASRNKLRITVNESHSYQAESGGETVSLDGESITPNLLALTDTRYHLLLDEKSFNITILDQPDEKHMTVSVNGQAYTVGIQDQYDLLLHDLGMDAALSSKADDVKAPMPGLVIRILVEAGEAVEKDTPLLILEAMKMENVLKSPGPGTIDSISVNERDAVEKGQLLVKFRGVGEKLLVISC